MVIALMVLALAPDSLVIGYVGMTLVLCAFLIVVAYDVGVTRRAPRA